MNLTAARGPRTRIALAVLSVTVALLGSLLAAPAQAAGPNHHLPKQGSCHRLTFAQAGSESESRPAVRCSSKHTTKTIGVLKLRGAVDWSSTSLLVTSYRFCRQRTERALGVGEAKVALSAYTYVFFYPSKAERRRGAKWVRCDLTLKAGASEFQQLPDRPAATLDHRRPNARVARCLRNVDGVAATTACTHRHSHRAVAAVKLSGRRYPGASSLQSKAQRVCPDRAGRRWTTTFPNELSWRSGTRTLVCYRLD